MKYNPHVFINSAVSLILSVLLFATVWLYVLISLILFALVIFWSRVGLRRGLLVSLICIGLGVITRYVRSYDMENFHDVKGYCARIITEPKQKGNRKQAQLKLLYTTNNQKTLPTKILGYFDAHATLKFGDIIWVGGTPTGFPPPVQPMGFDYGSYMCSKGVLFRHYIKEFRIVGHRTDPWVFYYANQLRNYCEAKIHQLVASPEEAGLLVAMVLGVKDGLDRDLRAVYAATGTMHVLAVSGLHVGILFYVIGLVINPLKKRRLGVYLYVATSIAVLWFYAVVTGLSPSVVRAVTMLSITTLALVFARKSSILNTLGFAAFVIVLQDYRAVYDIGFQLSFAAVLGIVLLYDPIYRIWFPSWVWVRYFWQLFAVSLAAQLATSPISLYYFHQFPTYFWLANLVVVPLSFFVLSGGIVLLACSWIPVLSVWIGKACFGLVWLMNTVVVGLGSLPGAVLTGFFPSLPQVFVEYALIAAVFLFVSQRKLIFLRAGLGLMIIHTGLVVWQHYSKSLTKSVIVADLKPSAGFVLVQNGKSALLLDRFDSEETIENKLGNFLQYYPQSLDFKYYTLEDSNRIFVFYSQRFWHISKKPTFKPAHPDFVLISHNALKNLSLLKHFNCRQVVLDNTNSYSYQRKVKNMARELGIDVYLVREQGFWSQNL